ncbi:MAG: hypothetical protein MK095_04450, partial [Phycisphaerales bacterium]|nr:hypothetical protein [Phycisphaerales bacterium]
MRTTQRTRLAALAATTVVSICSTEALADQACCVDTLYCIITQPEICDALGGTLRPDPNGTCEDWPASPCSNGAAGLHAPPHLQGGFGASMDLEFANGHVNHLVVGSPTTNETRGGATVMQWQIEEAFGGSWVEVSHFDLDTSSFAPGAYAGAAVAADGIWIAVGIPGRQEVRLFSNETGTWVERQTLTPIADGDDDGAFGLSLALDGSTLFIGAADSMPSGGRVSVFTTDGGTEQNPWVFEQHLTANVEGTQGFGYAIALDNQLGRAIIGAPFGGGGTAYSVQYADSEWEITRDLSLDLPAQYGELGAAVELVGDIAYIGNPGMNITGPTLGVVWAYQYSEDDTYPDSDFYMNTFIAAPEGSTGTQFGTSLNLQPGILLVGSPDEGGTGAVHIYTHPYNQPELIHFTWNAQINGSTVGEGFGASLVTGVLGADFDGATGGLALTGAPGAPSEPGGVSGAGRIDALNISDLNTGSSSFKPP